MPNRGEHFKTMTGFGVVGGIIRREELVCSGWEKLAEIGVLALVTGVGAMLADLFEPPRHPNHRGIGHSYLALATIGIVHQRYFQEPKLTFAQRALRNLLEGYAGHLVQDASTPKGLPFVV